MEGIIEKFKEANLDQDLPIIIPISTPSYVESHVEGYNRTIKALVEHLAVKSVVNEKINIITGNISPADVREVKNILSDLNCENIILTDTSKNLDAPLSESALDLYKDGTTIEEIEDTANSLGTIALSGPLPLGIENTDKFIGSVCKLGELEVPETIKRDRGRLIDAMVDAHSYNYHRKVAIFGDPDFVSGMTRFTCEMGMIPSVVCTGTKSKRFIEDIQIISDEKKVSPVILAGGDLYDMHREIKEVGADILVGNSYGASMAKEEDIPLFRVGFPIFDRLGAQRIFTLGYKGGINFVDQLTNTMLDYYYDEAGYEVNGDESEETIFEGYFAGEEV
jgi:nitrogenase molybdenum-iron protein beta chain